MLKTIKKKREGNYVNIRQRREKCLRITAKISVENRALHVNLQDKWRREQTECNILKEKVLTNREEEKR